MDTKEIIEALRFKAENIKAHIEPDVFTQAADLLEENCVWHKYPDESITGTGYYAVLLKVRNHTYYTIMHYSDYADEFTLLAGELPKEPAKFRAWLPLPKFRWNELYKEVK
jgi:hypothetical protein